MKQKMSPASQASGTRKNKQTNTSELSGPLKTRVLLTFLVLFVFSLPASAFAAVDITDVMYDAPGSDEGHEWVEITNKGTESVDISKYKFLEGGVNHKLTLATGSAVLVATASAIISNNPAIFLSEHPGFTRSVFKSSFSLSNTGETIALIDESGKIENSLTYTAAPKPAPTPVVKKSATPKPKTVTKTKSFPKTSTPSSYGDQPAAVPLSQAYSASPGTSLTTWLAGLAAIMGLGIVGALYARMQSTSKYVVAGETTKPEEKFELIED